MKRASRVALLLILVAVISTPVLAQEKGKKKGRKGQRRNAMMAPLLAKLKAAEPTDEQEKKIRAIVEAHRGKLQEATAKMKLTPEQRKAGAEAREKTKKDGVKGKEAQKLVDEAMKLSDDQKQARAALQEIRTALTKEIVAVLTPEQIEKAGIKQRGGRAGGKKRKKDQ